MQISLLFATGLLSCNLKNLIQLAQYQTIKLHGITFTPIPDHQKQAPHSPP
jgi:hypothetical protein